MTFHYSTQNSMTFQAWKAKKTKFRDFPGFPGPVRTLLDWFMICSTYGQANHSTRVAWIDNCISHLHGINFKKHHTLYLMSLGSMARCAPRSMCTSSSSYPCPMGSSHARPLSISCVVKLISFVNGARFRLSNIRVLLLIPTCLSWNKERLTACNIGHCKCTISPPGPAFIRRPKWLSLKMIIRHSFNIVFLVCVILFHCLFVCLFSVYFLFACLYCLSVFCLFACFVCLFCLSVFCLFVCLLVLFVCFVCFIFV